MGGELKLLEKTPTKVCVKHHAHDFTDRIEFNRRRVSSGYTLNLSNVTFVNKDKKIKDFRSSRTPNARNVNMAGEFIKSANIDN